MVDQDTEQEGVTPAGTPPALIQATETAEAAFLRWWSERVLAAKVFHDKAFKRMEEDMRFARGEQWPSSAVHGLVVDQTLGEPYVVNIVQSEIQASVSTLYAKNPTFTVARRKRMDFAVWDENPNTLLEAQMVKRVEIETGGPPAPAADVLLADVARGKMKRLQVDRVAKTLEIVFAQQIEQQHPDFKREMKQLIRRTETAGVGYMKLDFQRLEDIAPEEASRLADLTSRLAHVEALVATVNDPEEISSKEKEIEELRVAVETLRNSAYQVTREGLLVHFPRSTALIIDPACTQLEGFVGARWVAEEYRLTHSKILEVYGVDVRAKASPLCRATDDPEGVLGVRKADDKDAPNYDDIFRVWEVYQMDTGAVFTMCEGYDKYLRAPAAPKLQLERFYPYYVLTFNPVEDPGFLFPPSTVRLLRHQQCEINRSREMLRQHRRASAPRWVSGTGAFAGTEDQQTLETAPAFSVTTLNLANDRNIKDVLQPLPLLPIDPNVYDSSYILDDIRRITRRPEAAFGGVSSATATADSLAADNRQAEDRSKSDDVDDMLTQFARDAGTVLLLHMSKEMVQYIAGPGAAWPEANPHEVLQDISLEIEAGSSGRPNRALEVATLQRLFPVLMQTPGINPNWLAKTAIRLADANVDLTEAFLENVPSIQAMNLMARQQPGTGDPRTDPVQQGQEGGDKNPRPEGVPNGMGVSEGRNTVPDTNGGEAIAY